MGKVAREGCSVGGWLTLRVDMRRRWVTSKHSVVRWPAGGKRSQRGILRFPVRMYCQA